MSCRILSKVQKKNTGIWSNNIQVLEQQIQVLDLQNTGIRATNAGL